MPSRTLPPDLLITPEPPVPREPADAPDRPEPPEPPERASSSGLSGLRLVTVPGAWPPYDCETHGAACPAARAAAKTNPQARGQAPGSADPLVAAMTPTTLSRNRDSLAAATPFEGSPGAAAMTSAWPRKFAQVIVEILGGSRPPRQIVAYTTDRVRAHIDDLAKVLFSDQRPRIQRIVTSRPAASVVEMTVVVSFGPRSRALALRLEHMPARPAGPGLPARPARWLCTEIEAG